MSVAQRTLRSARSLPTLRGIHTSTNKAQPSHLLSNAKAQYASLTVNALKKECKQRGLRVSGRKIELVDRIAAFEMSKQFSTSSLAQAKGDDSHIDYVRMPGDTINKEPYKPPFKMVIPPDATYSAPETAASYKVEPKVPDTGATPVGVHVVSGDEKPVSTMNTELGSAELPEDEAPGADGSLPKRDKTILWGMVGAVAAWWGGSSLLSKKKNKH